MWQMECTIGMLYADMANKIIIIIKPHQHATSSSKLIKKSQKTKF